MKFSLEKKYLSPPSISSFAQLCKNSVIKIINQKLTQLITVYFVQLYKNLGSLIRKLGLFSKHE